MDRLTQAETKIGLLHHIGGGNLGDDATLEAVAGNIRQRLPNAELVAFSMNPDDTAKRHGIMSYPIRRRGWSIGYMPPQSEGTLRPTLKALTRRYTAIFYLVKAVYSLVRLPSEICRELSFLLASRRIIKSFSL